MSADPNSPDFDWFLFCDPANKPTRTDWDIASTLSGDWRTCACGQIVPLRLKSFFMLIPLDNRLAGMGMAFCDRICNFDQAGALEKLNEIQAHVKTL